MNKLQVYIRNNDGRMEWVAYFRHCGRAIDLTASANLGDLCDYAKHEGLAGINITSIP